MGEKCFCHLNGYQVKDAVARKTIEELEESIPKMIEELEESIQKKIEESIGDALGGEY